MDEALATCILLLAAVYLLGLLTGYAIRYGLFGQESFDEKRNPRDPEGCDTPHEREPL